MELIIHSARSALRYAVLEFLGVTTSSKIITSKCLEGMEVQA
jgi:hypothetical protein